MKSIIVYTRELKAQNLYPKRIISPPAPNKCCPVRMEVLGRPRLDEHGRRFNYKRCKVCGFAVRHFLDAVGTILPVQPMDSRLRRGPVSKPVPPPPPPAAPIVTRRPPVIGRMVPSSRHVPVKPAGKRVHAVAGGRKSASRRRR